MNLRDMIKPQRQVATREYVAEVGRALELDDDQAARVADYVIDQIEKIGSEGAILCFTTEGVGPCCSWCGALGGLCPHIAGRPAQCACKPPCEVSCGCHCHGGESG